MPDDRFLPPEYPEDHDDPIEVPPSFAFLEMMRRAANKPMPPIPTNDTQAAGPLFPDYMDIVPSAPVSESEVSKAAESPASDDTDNNEPQREPRASEPRPPDPTMDARMEAQRIQRVKRRSARRRRNAVGVFGGIVRSFIVVGVAGLLAATIFTWWTPSGFIVSAVRDELSIAQATSQATVKATSMATPNYMRRIGIVAGHRGPENDPGAVCPDGLTEKSITENVAQLVVRNLRGRGYSVDLLDEFDPRLNNYQSAALISIHANSCQDYGEYVSGYLIASPAARATAIGPDEALVNCVATHYAQNSNLERREGVTRDMTDYHSFREIHPLTPAAIVELGFMLADRDIMTERPDLLVRGITDGIICFLEPGSQSIITPVAATAVADNGA